MLPQRIAVLTLALALTAQAADTLPTTEEVQQLFDKQDWPGVLAATGRVLAVRGPAAAGYDRVDLWMKKGEAQLQTNQFMPASQSYGFAAAEKTVTPEQSDLALAMSELAKKSDNKGYKTPAKQGPVEVYDIRDATKRDAAFAALFKADLTDLKQRVTQAKAVTDSKALTDLAKAVGQLAPLDRVVNKSTTASDALQKSIGDNFVSAADAWSKTSLKEMDDIQVRADEPIDINAKDSKGRTVVRQGKKGISQADMSELQKITQAGEKLAGTYTAVEKALDEAGQTAIKPAQQVIQSTYDKAKSMQSTGSRVTVRGYAN